MIHFADLQAAPEDELRLALGLQNYTSGKGKVELKDSSMRPIEIFMCSVVSLEALSVYAHTAIVCAESAPSFVYNACKTDKVHSMYRCAEWAMERASAGYHSTSSDSWLTNMLLLLCMS